MIVACAHCHQVVEDQDDVIVELEDVHTCHKPLVTATRLTISSNSSTDLEAQLTGHPPGLGFVAD